MTLGEYPQGVPEQWRLPEDVFKGESGGIKRFADIAPAAGVDAVGLAGGSAVEDFDGDGFMDIVVSSWGLRDPLKYFRNQGDGTFVERAKEAGLDGQIGGLNLEQADYDNDGDIDLLVLRGAWMGEGGRIPNSLLANNGGGDFTDVTQQAGLFAGHPTHAAAFADYDNDGWLDLFVGGYNMDDLGDMARIYLGGGIEADHARVYRNAGDGTFSEVTQVLGVVDRVILAMGANYGDLDNDGFPDCYVGTGIPDLRSLIPNRMLRQ